MAFLMVAKVHRAVFAEHPLGVPNTNALCLRVDTNHGHAFFALGIYNQYVDSRICTITRMLYPCKNASHFLAVLRRYLRQATQFAAVATHTDRRHLGLHLKADGWVFTSNHDGRRRWIRTL